MDSTSVTAGLSASYNNLSSGSIAGTTSSSHTGVNMEDNDHELTFLTTMVTPSYDNDMHRNSFQQQGNQMWGSPSKLVDNQGIQLPSFMSSPSYQAAPLKHALSSLAIPRLLMSSQYSVFGSQDYSSLSLSNLKGHVDQLAGSPLQFGYSASNNSIYATSQRKKLLPVNVNAPSYSPSISGLPTYGQAAPPNALGIMSKPGAQVKQTHASANALHLEEPSDNDKVEMLKLELLFKNQVNKSLSEKLKLLKTEDASDSSASPGDGNVRMPNNYYQLFRDLTRTLIERTQELDDTKARLEAILVGLVMTKDSTVATYGTFDAQDLAHKITNKMCVLQKENEALLNMVSYSNKQSLLVEMGLLKGENDALRQRVKELESKP